MRRIQQDRGIEKQFHVARAVAGLLGYLQQIFEHTTIWLTALRAPQL